MSNIGIILISAAIGAIAGYLFGMVDSFVTGKMKKQEKESTELEPDLSALSVVFDLNQNLVVKMEGQPISAETMTPEQRERLKRILVNLAPLVNTAAEAPVIAQVVSTEPARLQPVPLKPVEPAVQPIQPDITMSARYVLSGSAKPATGTAKPRPTSIVGQIDEILQTRLAVTPLAQKKIALVEGIDHSVQVRVGDNIYPGIDAVPDEDVRTIIRQAIADWEKSSHI